MFGSPEWSESIGEAMLQHFQTEPPAAAGQLLLPQVTAPLEQDLQDRPDKKIA
jgi:hypothetical protein